jgi:hypothetical protein
MLRLVIDWFSRNSQVDCDIQFLEGSRWYSEALLPSQFLTRQRGDNLAESWAHADGVIGHFEIDKKSGKRLLDNYRLSERGALFFLYSSPVAA